MSENHIRRALISVYDKTGVVAFAQALHDEFGIEIISTGGTAALLKESGVPVTLAEKVTGFPEMMNGRVKTLHPKIHAGILADRGNVEHMRQLEEQGIGPIDMVVVSLYPFEETIAQADCSFEQAIEMIDIGGPCMLRAAAKNHRGVLPVPHTKLYDVVLKAMRDGADAVDKLRQPFAGLVFAETSWYDSQIHGYLSRGLDERFGSESMHTGAKAFVVKAVRKAELTYGENPHQIAGAYLTGALPAEATLLGARSHGPALSFNNYVDGGAALELIKELTRTYAGSARDNAVAFIKHTNPCGCAVDADPIEAYRKAFLGDPIAAAGGVLCVNFPVTRAFAEVVMLTFKNWGKAAGAAFFKLDVWIAPSFDADALKLIKTPTEKRKWGASCRLLSVGDMAAAPDGGEADFKNVPGGLLVQTRDLAGLDEEQWRCVTKRSPTDAEMDDLRFAWLVCKHTKSNAITLVKDGRLLGNGAGQMSRVMSSRIAVMLAKDNGHGESLEGAVAAGDAFFPVSDGPATLIDAGVRAIIHPGGSNRDDETVALCDDSGVAMIMTGTRHFKH